MIDFFKKNRMKWILAVLLAFSVVILGTSIEYYSIDMKAYAIAEEELLSGKENDGDIVSATVNDDPSQNGTRNLGGGNGS
ncbi:MAG: hypothetical protein J5781_06295, partial [Clostridia bacterium]|nr:hypothetical protein [Clostridia bacterium]